MTSFALHSFLTLFVVIDPVGIAPLFLGLAGRRADEDRSSVARRAVLVAAAILAFFGVAGGWLLHHIGISIDAFRVAGGLLLFRIAADMVFVQLERETKEEEQEARMREDITVFPLAIPLIAGPGALASVTILAGEARSHSHGVVTLFATGGAVLILVYVALRMASFLARLLGHTGVNVITRVLGVLLAALAVEYVGTGLRVLLQARTETITGEVRCLDDGTSVRGQASWAALVWSPCRPYHARFVGTLTTRRSRSSCKTNHTFSTASNAPSKRSLRDVPIAGAG